MNPVRSTATAGRTLPNRWVIGALIGLAIAFPHPPSPTEGDGPAAVRPVDPDPGSAATDPLLGLSRPVPLVPLAEDTRAAEVIGPSLLAAPTPPPVSLFDVGPTLLTLPSARLDKGIAVEPVDVNDQSRLIPPETAVGWYRNEAGLGRSGSALFVAHIAYNRKNGPFRWLDGVRVGDEATVDMADGSSSAYVVSSIAVYRKEDVPFDELAGAAGPDRIALVTCTGSFDKKKRSYDSNLVVVAVRQGATG